jgi:hypothetical protein
MGLYLLKDYVYPKLHGLEPFVNSTLPKRQTGDGREIDLPKSNELQLRVIKLAPAR